jgi:cell division protein FtsZ
METEPGKIPLVNIKVVGVGGGGGNAVDHMIASGGKDWVQFIAINTDEQLLSHKSQAPVRVLIGKNTAKGGGAKGDPEIGAKAAEESREQILDALKGAEMVFIVAGLGGGTGTGAAPVVAVCAKAIGALAVAIVTKPFTFERKARMNQAEAGIAKLKEKADTVIVIPNDRILTLAKERMPLGEAFRIADDFLLPGVQGLTGMIANPGLLNLDCADAKTILSNAGTALMGVGKAKGKGAASVATKAAIQSPFMENSIKDASAVLFNVTGGRELSLTEVYEASEVISGAADQSANVIFGAAIDESLEDEIRITVIATGFKEVLIK